jgi:hypothetical protein
MMIAAETEMFKLSVKPNIGILENHRRVAKFHVNYQYLAKQTITLSTQPILFLISFIKHFAMKK